MPAMSMEPGTWCTSNGSVSPWSIAAAAVITFATEPGSKGCDTLGFSKSLPCFTCWSTLPFGLIVSVLAIASTSPVWVSRTTAWASFASELALACSRVCWT